MQNQRLTSENRRNFALCMEIGVGESNGGVNVYTGFLNSVAIQRRHNIRSTVGYAEIWRSHDVIWQDTDKGASTSLDHHCGTLFR